MVASAGPENLLESPEARRYVDETVRVWLGLRAGARAEPPPLPEPLVRRFLRLEEYEDDRRDRWGRWEFDFSESFRDGLLWTAEVDRWLAEVRAGLPAEDVEPLWPDGKRFAVCVTHDVDVLSPRSTPRQVLRHARAGMAADGTRRRSFLRAARPLVRIGQSLKSGVARIPSLRETLERSVELEAARGIAASYLFTVPPGRGWSRYDCSYAPGDPCRFRGEAATVAEVMRTLAAEGFDVGLHGSYGAGLDPGALAAERELLRRSTGLEVTSTRQHLLHWDVRQSPAFQEDAGLTVDSSLGFNRNVGFRAGTSLPFRSFDAATGTTLRLLQIPPVVQDASLLSPWGLGLDPSSAEDVVRRLVDDAVEAGGALTFVFHPDKLVHPEWLSLYESTLDHVLERKGWLTSLAGLETWWREREARVLAA